MMKKILTTILVVFSMTLVSFGQSSSYLFEVEGNASVEDSLYVANDKLELLNYSYGELNDSWQTGYMNIYDSHFFGGSDHKFKRISFLSQQLPGLINEPAIALYDIDGDMQVLAHISTNNGGSIKLRDNEGDTRIELNAMESFGDGGQILISNADGDETIEIDGDSNNDCGIIKITHTDGTDRVRILGSEEHNSSNSGSAIYLYNSEGEKAIELDADLNGDSRMISDELQLNGGSDFAETFDIVKNESNNIEPLPGMLVSIDPNSSGKLEITNMANDRKLAGIISGANGIKPGLYMGQKGSIADGEYPVALTGRVYVKANEEGGIIEPGDLITSSSTPGYAMKANISNKYLQGTIVGKALTKSNPESEYILVLVNLQ